MQGARGGGRSIITKEAPPAPEEQAPPRRASALTAVGSVGLVAVLVATALSVWVRSSSTVVERPPQALEQPLPTELAGGTPLGEVPEAVAEAVGDAPVVAARALDQVPGFGGCHMDPAFDAGAQLRRAVLTPDGLHAEYVGPAPPGMFGPMPERVAPPAPAPPVGPNDGGVTAHATLPEPMVPEPVQAVATCTAEYVDGSWSPTGGSFGMLHEAGAGLGASASCCDAEGLGTATATVRAPDGARWALQERGEWWLAVPADDRGLVALSWKFRDSAFGRQGGSAHVLWVSAEGDVIDETYVSL